MEINLGKILERNRNDEFQDAPTEQRDNFPKKFQPLVENFGARTDKGPRFWRMYAFRRILIKTKTSRKKNEREEQKHFRQGEKFAHCPGQRRLESARIQSFRRTCSLRMTTLRVVYTTDATNNMGSTCARSRVLISALLCPRSDI